ELNRGLLRESEEKVGKVEAGAVHGNAIHQLRCIETGEYETSARVGIGFCVDLDAAEVASPAHSVLSVAPDHGVGERKSLISAKEGIRVLNCAEVGKRQIGKSPIEGIGGDACDANVARDVLVKGVKILSGDTVAVVVETEAIS